MMNFAKLWTAAVGILVAGWLVGCKAPSGDDDQIKTTRTPSSGKYDGYRQARRALDQPDTVEAFRITSVWKPVPDGFHGYPVEQRVVVTDLEARERLLSAVRDADVEEQGFAMACMFQPHHALRLTGPGGTTDYVLCFKCAQARAYLPDGQPALFNTDATAQAAFEAVLGPRPATRP